MDPIRSKFLHVFRKPDQTCSKSLQFLKRGIRVLSDREVERGGAVVKFLQAGFKLCIRAGTCYANLLHSF